MNQTTTAGVAAGGGDIDRPNWPELALEPVRLMAAALRACEADAGAKLLDQVGLLSLIGLVSWPYRDPVRQLAAELGIAPDEQVNASMGGETPVRLAHEAAARIVPSADLLRAIVDR